MSSSDNLTNSFVSSVCVAACLTELSRLNDSTRCMKCFFVCFGEPAKSCLENTPVKLQKEHIAFDMDC